MEELATIDTSVAEALEEITSELETLVERLRRLEGHRGKVSEEVYERVHADYQSRKDSLEAEASPLREQVLGQYAAAREALEALEQAARQLALQKEEVDLRRDLGEFTDEAYTQRMQEIASDLEENEKQLTEARRFRDLFALALREEPEAGAGSANSSTQPLLQLEQENATEAPDIPFPEVTNEAATAEDAGTTAAAGTEPADAAAEEPTDEPYAGDATVFIQWPKLVGQAEDGSTVEYPVAGSRTTLGRDPENDIALSGKKVSKMHAEIVLVEDGYEIRDLESTAGTLVNGVQVTAWKLSNGDSVQLGDVVLVFMES